MLNSMIEVIPLATSPQLVFTSTNQAFPKVQDVPAAGASIPGPTNKVEIHDAAAIGSSTTD